jgi:undecaprenyl-diphosphatase
MTIAALVLLTLGLVLTVPSNPEWWKVIVLGVVQGLTEFLPISSTGHLLIAADLLDYGGSIGGTFEIFIQFGTVISVVAYYFRDLFGQLRAVFGQGDTPADTRSARRFWATVLVAFVPAAIVGLLAREWIKTVLFESPQVIATSLIVGGIVFIVVELLPRKAARTADLESVSFGQALGIGLAQTLALIPGVSRSGASIFGGLFAGLNREVATRFAFYLAVPTLGLATLVDLIGSFDQIAPSDWGNLLLGATVAMIVGWLSIDWLLRYVSRNTFIPFGIYRIIAGVIILALVAVGRL